MATSKSKSARKLQLVTKGRAKRTHKFQIVVSKHAARGRRALNGSAISTRGQ